jgi:hypothetical protein
LYYIIDVVAGLVAGVEIFQLLDEMVHVAEKHVFGIDWPEPIELQYRCR